MSSVRAQIFTQMHDVLGVRGVRLVVVAHVVASKSGCNEYVTAHVKRMVFARHFGTQRCDRIQLAF